MKTHQGMYLLLLSIFIITTSNAQWLERENNIYYNKGNVGIGTDKPEAKLSIVGEKLLLSDPQNDWKLLLGRTENRLGHIFGFYLSEESPGTQELLFYGGNANNEHKMGTFSVQSKNLELRTDKANLSGELEVKGKSTFQNDVSIAAKKVDGYKLSVGGNIIAEKLVVKLQTQWPDNVFSSSYKLRSLDEVEKFIQKNKHLPEIPSAQEMQQKDGVDVGKLQSDLLKKVEELTLYVIEQNKQLTVLQKRNSELEKTIDSIQQEVKK